MAVTLSSIGRQGEATTDGQTEGHAIRISRTAWDMERYLCFLQPLTTLPCGFNVAFFSKLRRKVDVISLREVNPRCYIPRLHICMFGQPVLKEPAFVAGPNSRKFS
jgi:hypothetical protein